MKLFLIAWLLRRPILLLTSRKEKEKKIKIKRIRLALFASCFSRVFDPSVEL